MRKFLIVTMLFVLVVLGVSVIFDKRIYADGLTARDIMKKVEDRNDGDSMISDMKMVLIDKGDNQRVRDLKVRRKDIGVDSYRIMFFQSPSDVKNTGFLTYDYDDSERDDDQWLYLPALRKVKRISASEQNNSFMGSDLNYSDMTSRQLEKYDYKIIKEMKVKGDKVWLIEQLPKKRKTAEDSGYKKSLLFVRQDNFFVIRSILWEDKGGHIKYYDVSKLEKINDIWVAVEFTMVRKLGNTVVHKTIVNFKNIKFNKKIDNNYFSQRQLKKGA